MGPLRQIKQAGLQAAAQAYAAATDGRNLIADIVDGAALRVRTLGGAGKFVVQFVMSVAEYLVVLLKYRVPLLGGKVEPRLNLDWIDNAELPFELVFDPTYDFYPSAPYKFVGGPYHNKAYPSLGDGNEKKTFIVLKGGHGYRWDGHVFKYEEPATIDEGGA